MCPARTGGRARSRMPGGRPQHDGAVTQAREVLGVAGPLTREILRDRYRRLMKRFHPDLNPRGLEKSKEINTAYAVLSAELAAGGV